MGDIDIVYPMKSFIRRLIKINRIASDYEYEEKFKNPEKDALKELLTILDKKLNQWEYELKYDFRKRGKNQ